MRWRLRAFRVRLRRFWLRIQSLTARTRHMRFGIEVGGVLRGQVRRQKFRIRRSSFCFGGGSGALGGGSAARSFGSEALCPESAARGFGSETLWGGVQALRRRIRHQKYRIRNFVRADNGGEPPSQDADPTFGCGAAASGADPPPEISDPKLVFVFLGGVPGL